LPAALQARFVRRAVPRYSSACIVGTPPLLMSATEHHESLRHCRPVVHVDVKHIDPAADAPLLARGIDGPGAVAAVGR